MKDSLIKDYLHIFKIPFLLFALLLAVTIGFRAAKGNASFVRGNNECTAERVFDYADKLTDEEEEALRKKIEKAQNETGCDIIVVILEESLEDYAKSYESQIGRVEPYQYTMVYADNFYDENRFGFDAPYGDGILLLDNWYREADGGLYSWISTSGKAYRQYSDAMLDTLKYAFVERVQIDPAEGYELFVDMVAEQMNPSRGGGFDFVWQTTLVFGAVVTLVFFFVNYGGRKGKKTVAATTYVRSKGPDLRVKEDQFLHTTVTRRRIKTSSGNGGGHSHGGGGGGHVSAGGHTHGGGGVRR